MLQGDVIRPQERMGNLPNDDGYDSPTQTHDRLERRSICRRHGGHLD